ncbi:hypothetical protein RD110_20405 [Rhodoferax koreense]|uniref:DUF2059 domain-containing protein n=1 Tax=Rhodoferax koreensis TaxID=1842727 RepID=A0A1P8JZX3_9BURK|nr:DUF2059 domain-containing protein [Rhodoferax koreense]APW39285.1 hypothetical protein RD110_20405 [Rhodoferax koreense]
MKKYLWSVPAVSAIALFAVTGLAHAESTPAKKELVAKVIRLQMPVREQMMRQMAQSPVASMAQQVGQILQFRVPPEKREALTKEIQGYIGKYVDETMALLREREAKAATTVIGPMLEEKFSEDELKQLVTFLESPVQKKYLDTTAEGLKALSTQLVADTRGVVESKFKVMEQTVTKRLNEVVGPAAAPASPAAPSTK